MMLKLWPLGSGGVVQLEVVRVARASPVLVLPNRERLVRVELDVEVVQGVELMPVGLGDAPTIVLDLDFHAITRRMPGADRHLEGAVGFPIFNRIVEQVAENLFDRETIRHHFADADIALD